LRFKRPLDGLAFVVAVLALTIIVVWLSGRLLGWQFGSAEMLLIFIAIAVIGRTLIALLNHHKQCSGSEES